MLYNSRSACIDPEVKRSKVKVKRLRHTVTKIVTVARLLVTRAAAVGVSLHVNTTAYVF